MAKTRKQIYDEEIALLNHYLSNNDYKGMYLHMENNIREVVFGDAEEAEPMNNAWSDFLQEISISKNPVLHRFAGDFFRFSGQRIGDLMIDTGMQTDDIEQQIKNGELEGTELITSEPKLIHGTALSINTNKTPLGQAQNNIFALNQFILTPLRNKMISRKDALESEYVSLRNEAAHNAFDNDSRVDQETNLRYRKELSGQQATNVMISSSQDSLFDGIGYDISNKLEGPVFSKVSELEDYFKAMNDEDLERYKQELITNRDVMAAYNAAGKEWADRSAAFLKELEEKTSPEEQSSEAYRQLKEALALNADFGQMRSYTVLGDPAHKKTLGFTQETFADFSEVLKKAAETWPDKDFSAKILSAAEAAGQKLDRCYAAGVSKVREKSLSFSGANPKQIEVDIRRVQAEQDLRALKTDPHGKELKSLQDTIRSHSSLQSDIILFKDAVRKSIYACDYTNEDLQKDAAERKIPEKDRNKHQEYLTLLDSFKGLKDMDPAKLSPAQILDRLKTVSRDADAYVNSHVGIRNFTKAWSPEGRDRVALVRSIHEAVDKQIQALEPAAKALEKKIGADTLENGFNKLQQKKSELRTQAAAVKADILTPPDKKIENRIQAYRSSAGVHAAQRLEDAQNADKRPLQKTGTIMESAANVAAESLSRLHELVRSKQPLSQEQKEAALTDIARVVCYDRPMFSENKNMNEAQFKDFIKPFETGKFYRDSVKDTLGDISQESLRKFCLDPSISKNIAEKAAGKHINYAVHDYSQKKLAPTEEKNVNGPEAGAVV